MPKFTLSCKNAAVESVVAAINSTLEGKARVKLAFASNDQGDNVTLEHEGAVVTGLLAITQFLVEQTGRGASLLGGGDPEALAAVAGWLEFMPKAPEGALAFMLNAHLTLRSFMVGYEVTLADLVLWQRFLCNMLDAKAYPYAARWFKVLNDEPSFAAAKKAKKAAIKAAKKAARKGKTKANQTMASADLPLDQQVEEQKKIVARLEAAEGTPEGQLKMARGVLAKLLKRQEETAAIAEGAGPSAGSDGYVDLEGAVDGEVVTRFPPEPSGYLHIGHAKAALLNAHYAKRYNGKLLLRFDDTNPSKEKDEFVENIIADLAVLGIKADALSHTSDHFDLIQDYARTMISKGLAYVDNTPVDVMREERMARKESASRANSVETNMELFEHMLAGDEIGVGCCLRGKIDMKANNACMRDPVFYRCNLTPHLRTGTKYKAYPTYDFACPIVDSIEGVTHALRTNEYHDRNEQFYWVVDALELRKPLVAEYSRLNFQYTVMSKRKLQWFVNEGLVDGWFDPRFPTVQGVMRRGLTLDALWEFIAKQGSSLKVNTHEWNSLWAINKRVIDPVIPRHIAVPSDSRATFTLTDVATTDVKTVDAHPKNPDVGTKSVVYSSKLIIESEDAARCSVGDEITLMNWGNAIVDAIDTADDGTIHLTGHLHLDGDFKTTKIKMTWLTAEPAFSVPVKLVEYHHLITKQELETGDNVNDFIRTPSKYVTDAVVDANVAAYPVGTRLQFLRRGYYIVDKPYISASSPMELIYIPDGRQNEASALSNKVQK